MPASTGLERSKRQRSMPASTGLTSGKRSKRQRSMPASTGLERS